MTLLCTVFFIAAAFISGGTPDRYRQTEASDFGLDLGVGLTASPSVQGSDFTAAESGSGNTLLNREAESFSADIRLFGVIPVKTVTVERVEGYSVIPGGTPFGLEIFSEGVMVVSVMPVEGENGSVCPGSAAGIKTSDIILAIDGVAVSSNSDVQSAIEQSGGSPLVLSLKRGDKSFTAEVVPVKSSSDGKYRAGLWVRDSSAGIGTLTFVDGATGLFAGLGHAVCDIDTGDLIPVSTGDIFSAVIDSVSKSTKGVAGQLLGHIDSDKKLGKLLNNRETGVYGLYGNAETGVNTIRVAMKQEVHRGEAEIITTISGGPPKSYKCVIENIDYRSDSGNRDMVIKVTDEELLEKTGGIVQGMSGSPVIQNGTLVGAVTHVFINRPDHGYGIFAETMLYELLAAADSSEKKAS